MVFFTGGADARSEKQYFDDLWTYNTTSKSWTRIQSLNSPPPMAFHTVSDNTRILYN